MTFITLFRVRTMIRVKVLGRGIEKEMEWRKGLTVAEVLRAVGFNTESAIARVNGRVALEEEKVEDGAYVEVIPVVSGG
ncbi:MAG: sulfur carrier protein [Thermococcaceae archaeon]|nr:sulfur carrier protein [Thermococcaceae archaeon]MDK2914754.1 sulfur carrier protein [Thermococcaceae archaeon]